MKDTPEKIRAYILSNIFGLYEALPPKDFESWSVDSWFLCGNNTIYESVQDFVGTLTSSWIENCCEIFQHFSLTGLWNVCKEGAQLPPRYHKKYRIHESSMELDQAIDVGCACKRLPLLYAPTGLLTWKRFSAKFCTFCKIIIEMRGFMKCETRWRYGPSFWMVDWLYSIHANRLLVIGSVVTETILKRF